MKYNIDVSIVLKIYKCLASEQSRLTWEILKLVVLVLVQTYELLRIFLCTWWCVCWLSSYLSVNLFLFRLSYFEGNFIFARDIFFLVIVDLRVSSQPFIVFQFSVLIFVCTCRWILNICFCEHQILIICMVCVFAYTAVGKGVPEGECNYSVQICW